MFSIEGRIANISKDPGPFRAGRVFLTILVGIALVPNGIANIFSRLVAVQPLVNNS